MYACGLQDFGEARVVVDARVKDVDAGVKKLHAGAKGRDAALQCIGCAGLHGKN